MALITPAVVLGTSTVALSDSTTMILWSFSTVSPTDTKISATVALSTPKSGTAISTAPAGAAAACGAASAG